MIAVVLQVVEREAGLSKALVKADSVWKNKRTTLSQEQTQLDTLRQQGKALRIVNSFL